MLKWSLLSNIVVRRSEVKKRLMLTVGCLRQLKVIYRRFCRQETSAEQQPALISFRGKVSKDEPAAGQHFDTAHPAPAPPPNQGPTENPYPVVAAVKENTKPTTFTTTHSLALETAPNTAIPAPQTPSAPSDLPSPISLPAPNANIRRERCFWPAKPSLLGCISEPEGVPLYGGAFSNVWCCKIRFCASSDTLPTEVAVKVLRPISNSNTSDTLPDERLIQRFQEERRTWSGLQDHSNIVPLIGWTLAPSLSFISPWYKQGSLARYMKTKEISRMEGLQLLLDVAKGLEYLHSLSPPVVHGDLKPDNILLSDEGKALLTDFGLSTIMGQESMYTSSHLCGGSVPWMSPEQMKEGSKSCQSDVYSFGSLAFTVLTGKPPHAKLTHVQIIRHVCDDTNPKDPVKNWREYPQIKGSIGDLLRDCWSRSPDARPPMLEVVRRITALLESRET